MYQNNENETEKSQINSIIKETNFSIEALSWYQYGFKVIPILPGSKKPATMRDPWLKNLSGGKVQAHWSAHPDHEIGCILNDDLIVFEAEDPESVSALAEIEERYGLKSKLVVKSAKGVHHYFRCDPSTIAISTALYSKEKFPERIYIKTCGDLVILPISRGKSISILEAKNTDELPIANQEFIDAIYHHNGMTSPSELVKYGKPQRTVVKQVNIRFKYHHNGMTSPSELVKYGKPQRTVVKQVNIRFKYH